MVFCIKKFSYRNFFLAVLIYIGIRMAISSVAQDKAMYKKNVNRLAFQVFSIIFLALYNINNTKFK